MVSDSHFNRKVELRSAAYHGPTKRTLGLYEGLGVGSGIHYSLKIKPIIHLIKILGYSLK